jgi:hypothetical protein
MSDDHDCPAPPAKPQNDMPRERSGEHILFCARIRSKVAKKRGDALGDLANQDIESDLRVRPHTQLAEVMALLSSPLARQVEQR